MELLQVEPTTDNKPETDTKDLASLLSEYGQPAEIINNPLPNTETKNSNQGFNIGTGGSNLPPGTNPNNWQGDRRYFQTGTKKGQLRPQGPKVVYNQNNVPASISGDLISGAMFLAMINLLFPVLIAALHNLTVKKKEEKIKWNEISMSREQENKLAPMADIVAKKVMLTWSPEGILFFSMLGLYTMNYMILRMEKSLSKESSK